MHNTIAQGLRARTLAMPSCMCTQVGKVKIGSDHRVALQTMTTSDTRDVEASVTEVKRCADAGADLVRLTVQVRLRAQRPPLPLPLVSISIR